MEFAVHPEGYHYRDGNYHALASDFLIHQMLERIGIARERFLIDWASVAVGPSFYKIITAFTEKNERSLPRSPEPSGGQ